MNNTKSLPVTVIKPRTGWQVINWRELAQYKDLFYFFVLRDIKVLYKQTILGFAWAVIRPVFSMLVFSVVFGGLAKVPSDGVPYPIFSFTALLPWTYFQTALLKSSDSLITDKAIFTKVYYPRLITPMAPVLSGLVDFAIAFVILIGMMFFYGIIPTFNVLFLPLMVLLMILTASGMGMWLSSMAVQFRDVKHAMPFVAQLLMYAAPVVWPVSLITAKFPEYGSTIRLVYGLYPMAGVIEGFRACLLGTRPMPWDLLAMGAGSALLIVFTGALYFRRKERIFADVA